MSTNFLIGKIRPTAVEPLDKINNQSCFSPVKIRIPIGVKLMQAHDQIANDLIVMNQLFYRLSYYIETEPKLPFGEKLFSVKEWPGTV